MKRILISVIISVSFYMLAKKTHKSALDLDKTIILFYSSFLIFYFEMVLKIPTNYKVLGFYNLV